MDKRQTDKPHGDLMRRGRLETDREPRREPVAISTNTLDHWPRKLGSLDLDDVVQLGVTSDRDLSEMFLNLFTDLFPIQDEDWPAVDGGGDHGIRVNGA